VLSIAGVAEEADEGIFVVEVGTVELRTSEGKFGSGVAVGISESVPVAVTVELRVAEGSFKPSEVAVVAAGSS